MNPYAQKSDQDDADKIFDSGLKFTERALMNF